MVSKVDSTMELVKNLAKEMGVSESDVLCLARSVASSIEKDRSSQGFIDASNEIQCEMVHVYAEHSSKKIN